MNKEVIKSIMLDAIVIYSKALSMDVFDDSKLGENFEKLLNKYLEKYE